MARTLVVPLIRPEEDPEGASESALPMARTLAERLAADVLLMSVLELPAEATDDGGQRLLHAADAFPNDDRLLALREQTLSIVADLEAYLTQVAGRFPAGRTRTVLRYGDADREIPLVASTLDDPVVVMASHARRGIQRAVVGSVAFKVVSEATCPVVIVPVAATAQPDTPVTLRRLLVPLDGSLMAEYALSGGIGTDAADPFEFHLVQVIEPLTVRSGMVADDYYAMAREEARQYLEGVAERLRQQGHQAEWSIQLGTAAEQIAQVAAQVDADMIVMATHGRSGFRRAVLGSVAERVLHSARLPLLLVRPSEDDLKANASLSSP